jgi:hypothetical protein
VEGCCEHDNEFSGSVIYWDWWLFEKDLSYGFSWPFSATLEIRKS